jgi:hypothetical protein
MLSPLATYSPAVHGTQLMGVTRFGLGSDRSAISGLITLARRNAR